MGCNYGEEHIQAYLDGELSREARKEMALHLEACAGCREKLQAMKRLDEWVKTVLTETLTTIGAQEKPSPDVQAAWEKFQTRLADDQQEKSPVQGRGRPVKSRVEEAVPRSGEKKPTLTLWKGRWETMNIAQKRWMAGGVAAAVIASALFVPQVRAVASDVLGLLRIEKLQMVKLTPEDIAEIQANIASLTDGKAFDGTAPHGDIDLKGLGHMSVVGKGEQGLFTSPEEARQAGIKVPDLKGYTMTKAGSHPAFSTDMKLDVAMFEKLSGQMGAPVTLAPELNNQTISLSFGESSFMQYQSDSDPQVGLNYGVTASPQLQVPAGVDMDQVRGALLMSPLFPENVRKQLANIQDWEKTLPIPYVEGKDYTEDVKVKGAPGVFVAYSGGHSAVLIWQKDGLLHVLALDAQEAEGKDNKALKDTLLDVANQI